ncbi:hypothetical protein AMTRI_Chr01g135540 [Amborella trichopoda]
MENGVCEEENTEWKFIPNKKLLKGAERNVRAYLLMIISNLATPIRNLSQEEGENTRPVIHMGHGDPSSFPCFRTTPVAEDSLIDSIRSAKFNCYSPSNGMLPAREAVAKYLSADLPYELSADDVFLSIGCAQAAEIMIAVLARPGANILLPRPTFPIYEGRALYNGIEVRFFDLLPDRGWEVDLNAVEALADTNTSAIVIVNPINPCGNVFSYEHLSKVAETAKKLGILVISDEVYAHLTFGDRPFIPMGVFGSIAPVITLGSISKRWSVPGWRMGWLVLCDPSGILKKTNVVQCIKNYVEICCDPATITQGALPHIIEKTDKEFFSNIVNMLKLTAEICYNAVMKIPCIYCPTKPEASMFVMVKLDVSQLHDISDDVDFCSKLAREESVILMPGIALAMPGWLRIAFAISPHLLEDGIKRIQSFCQRHSKHQ